MVFVIIIFLQISLVQYADLMECSFSQILQELIWVGFFLNNVFGHFFMLIADS